VNLVEVFNAMHESKEPLPDAKADAKTIKAYFEKVFPVMDMERVYGSDMKKMIRWYDILSKAGVEIKLSEASEEETGADQPAQAEKKTAKVVAPKAAAPKNNAPAKKINSPRKMA
jgi:DNA repair ATPase RecN